jgi:TadE-like protein
MQFGIRHGSDNGSGCGSDFGSDSESGCDRDRDGVAPRVERGQATVEFALVLVALVSVVWALLSLCLIVRDQVLVTHASREAARTYAVSRSLDAATLAARDRSGLGSELAVTVEPQADNLARITVSLGIASRIPIVGRFRPDLRLQSSLITYVEPG